jgi:hypothetical protein
MVGRCADLALARVFPQRVPNLRQTGPAYAQNSSLTSEFVRHDRSMRRSARALGQRTGCSPAWGYDQDQMTVLAEAGNVGWLCLLTISEFALPFDVNSRYT